MITGSACAICEHGADAGEIEIEVKAPRSGVVLIPDAATIKEAE
jgi:hypothetical protein